MSQVSLQELDVGIIGQSKSSSFEWSVPLQSWNSSESILTLLGEFVTLPVSLVMLSAFGGVGGAKGANKNFVTGVTGYRKELGMRGDYTTELSVSQKTSRGMGEFHVSTNQGDIDLSLSLSDLK